MKFLVLFAIVFATAIVTLLVGLEALKKGDSVIEISLLTASGLCFLLALKMILLFFKKTTKL